MVILAFYDVGNKLAEEEYFSLWMNGKKTIFATE